MSGDATDPTVLVQAHIARAGMLVIASPDSLAARKMIETERTLNPGIEVVLRTHTEEELALLTREGPCMVFLGEQELAQGMVRHVRERMGTPYSRQE